jgi:hypothetical protein
MTTELTLSPALAEDLKALRRDKAYEDTPVVIDATVAGDRGTPERTSPQFVREGVPRSPDPTTVTELDRFPAPTILAASGPLDACVLALCCACTVSYVDPDSTLTEIDPTAALALGLAGRLTDRLGPGAATQILLGNAPPLGLAIGAEDPLAAARAAAARLADPAAALLPRSLAFAARSTPAQAAAYDSELHALLTDPRERPR